MLPVAAGAALGATGGELSVVHGVCHGVALVLPSGGTGVASPWTGGAASACRLAARAGTASGALLVGARHGAAVVVVAPTTVLDGLRDLLVGESR